MKINSSKLIQVNNLSVSYYPNKDVILKYLNLDINKGEHLAIIGESGCGKSTFAKSIVQMLPKSAICKGNVSINGQDPINMGLKDLKIFRRSVFGYIYQDSIKKLNPLMTVGEHLYELIKIHFKEKSHIQINKLVKETFNKVGIENKRLNSYPHEFSGGMRQRVCIALAIVLNPPLTIADEPTTSLDSYTSYEIMGHLLSLCETYQSTLILISHDIKLAAKWCKQIAIMHQGRIVEKGLVADVLNKPQSNIGKKLVKAISISIKPYYSGLNEVVLEAINLRYWYKLNSSILRPNWNKALNEVSFKLYRDETLGIVGISGSGKSTLCRVLIGLIKERGGQINIYNKDAFRTRKNKNIYKAKDIQMIFQDPFSSLNPKMKVRKTLEDVFLMHNKGSKNEMINEIYSVLNNLNLPIDENFLNSYPNQLSGGQLQRISIARAILIKPRILICDESVNMLDASVKIEILLMIRKIQEEMSLSIIFITHDLGLAKRFCNRLIVMHDGMIVEQGEALSMIKNPKHLITRKLLNSSLDIN